MHEQENIALVQGLYEAFLKGDIRFVLDRLTEDVYWSSPGPDSIPYAGDRVGPAQVREFFERLAGTQENVRLTVHDYVAQGDLVATLGRYSGTVKANGRSFDTVIGHFFTIRDGKVARWIGLGDTANAQQVYAIGAGA